MGTIIGGRKAAGTIKKKHGKDFYKKIGLKGHEAWVKGGRRPRGFAVMTKEKRIAAAKLGGLRSKRGAVEK